MREELLAHYENELTFLREMGAEFAARYPRIASRLALEPDRCEDPHTERLLEGFAFLAARVHLKIDDEFPEIATLLLERGVSAFSSADPVRDGGAVPTRSGTRQGLNRAAHSPRRAVVLQGTSRGHGMQVPDLL